jgi:protein-S-isoprenylcysteine O-methyltransferase Ste14
MRTARNKNLPFTGLFIYRVQFLTMYYILFGIAFICFGFHTAVHMLEHLKKISGHKGIYAAIGISMFIGWFSYFYMSFTDPVPMNLYGLNYTGLIPVIAGFYLFFVSHSKIHRRMHSGKGELVTDGLYRRIRHPMYLGEILMLLGAPILGQGLLTLFLSPAFIIQILIWRYLEEKELAEEFPEYAEYKKRTLF